MERRALQAASVGLKAKEIGVELGYTPDSIRGLLRNARLRLRAKNTTHACCEALRQGLIS
jgi:DNA-binding CsgD family transcriptional regulator